MQSNKKIFPNWWQSILITFCLSFFILCTIVIRTVLDRYYYVNSELLDLLQYVIPVGSIVVILFFITKKNVDEKKPINLSLQFNLKTISFVLVILLALNISLILPILNFIPIPDYLLDILKNKVNETSIYTFTYFVVCAPIFEEYIFRGVILKGLLTNTSVPKAILLSSLLFGLGHLNPWQLVTGFFIGVYSGWLFYKTNNLKLSILIHMSMNAFGFFSRFYWKNNMESIETPYLEFIGGYSAFFLSITISITLLVFGIKYLNKNLNELHFKTKKNEN